MAKPKQKDLDNYDYQFKIILIGNSGVGKSNFLSRFIHGIFNISSKTTIGIEFGSKIVEYEGIRVQVQLWDTLGQDRYKQISKLYYRGAVGCILMFDLSTRDSFLSIDGLLEGIRENLDKQTKILLCGNKKDLERQVTTEEARCFAQKESLGYIETSIKDNINVTEGMEMIIKQICKDIESGGIQKKSQSEEKKQEENFKLKKPASANAPQKKGDCC